jgi:hypothetical protein
MSGRMNLEKLARMIAAGFEAVELRFQMLELRLEKLEKRMDGIDFKIDEKVSLLEIRVRQQFDVIYEQLGTVQKVLDNHEFRIIKLEKRI